MKIELWVGGPQRNVGDLKTLILSCLSWGLAPPQKNFFQRKKFFFFFCVLQFCLQSEAEQAGEASEARRVLQTSERSERSYPRWTSPPADPLVSNKGVILFRFFHFNLDIFSCFSVQVQLFDIFLLELKYDIPMSIIFSLIYQ